ncbi:hypothetical protein L208DRAFT_536174 [Tricholoma matsutake]|nr:hypothetical protein L208DRAFT_536174 [Tricholoma matsutake 945]
MTKVRARWLTAGWEKELTHKVCNTKQGVTPFRDFSTNICRDNLLLKNTKYHLSPAQLQTQIESNLSHNLLHVYDLHKEGIDSESESNDKNVAPGVDEDPAAVTEASARKAEHCLEDFVQMLIKLDDKVHEENASCQKEAEDAIHKLKRTGSSAGLVESLH